VSRAIDTGQTDGAAAPPEPFVPAARPDPVEASSAPTGVPDIVEHAAQAIADERLALGERATSGNPSPQAIAVMARARIGAEWSALRERLFPPRNLLDDAGPPIRVGLWACLGAAPIAAVAVFVSLPAARDVDAATALAAYGARLNQPPAPAASEERPPSGTSGQFSPANIRYCTFQQVRLEAAGPIIESADMAVFNAHVDDWNARCARYRYAPSDKAAIDAEAVDRRALLEAEGRALMTGWRRKILTTIERHPAPAADFGPGLNLPPRQLAGTASRGQPAEPLPHLITLGRTAPDETDQGADVGPKLPSLTLLRTDVAVLVQNRLTELGYTISPANGTWGSMSRVALRRFKEANGLLGNDAFDAETAARLFATSAARAPAGGVSEGNDVVGAIETAYPPPAGAGMNPLNRAEGQRIQRRLAELGYYVGGGDGLWGAASRNALRAFKLANGLGDDDLWNAMTETVLLDEQAARAPDGAVRRVAAPAPAAAAPPAKRTLQPAGARSAETPRPPGAIPGAKTSAVGGRPAQ